MKIYASTPPIWRPWHFQPSTTEGSTIGSSHPYPVRWPGEWSYRLNSPGERERPRAHGANPILLEWRVNKRDPQELLTDLISSWAMRFDGDEIDHAYEVIDRWIEVFR